MRITAPCLLGGSNDLAEVIFPTIFHITENDAVHWAPEVSGRARAGGPVSDTPVTRVSVSTPVGLVA